MVVSAGAELARRQCILMGVHLCTGPQTGEVAAVAVAIPCYNEAVTIAKVVRDFRAALPGASIHVFDNNSDDESVALARAAGARVTRVQEQGKGSVVQTIFATVHADALVLVDGDDTYEASEATFLLRPVLCGEADMVVGDRMGAADPSSLRRLHILGNWAIRWFINLLAGTEYRDVLSGYRCFSRGFTESVTLTAPGFEVEAELTLASATRGLVVKEVPISYRARPSGSQSKLSSFRDGWRITRFALSYALTRDPGSLARRVSVPVILFLIAALVATWLLFS